MNSMLDIASISAIIAVISVLVGVVFAIFQMRDAANNRKTGLIIQLNPSLQVGQKEMFKAQAKVWALEFKDFKEFVEKYGRISEDNPTSEAIGTYASYYEGIGFLLNRKLISRDVIGYLVGGADGIRQVWERLKPIIEGMRIEYKLPNIYRWFEYLFTELHKEK